MKFLVVLLLCVLAVVKAADFQCFECEDCKSSVGLPRRCAPRDDVCMKVINSDLIVRKCATNDVCGLGKLERATDRAWTSVVNLFKDVDQDATLVYCCDNHLCNAGFKNLPSFTIIALPLILVALFKY